MAAACSSVPRHAQAGDPAPRDGGGSRVGTAILTAAAHAIAAAAADVALLEHGGSGPSGGRAQPAPALLQPGPGGKDLGHRYLRRAGSGGRKAPARALLQTSGRPHRTGQRPHHPGTVPTGRDDWVESCDWLSTWACHRGQRMGLLFLTGANDHKCRGPGCPKARLAGDDLGAVLLVQASGSAALAACHPRWGGQSQSE